ncbi:unnamed protein product [Heterobilharzia americana]|nr:unnamed protein product [Heterobilharzia americana]
MSSSIIATDQHTSMENTDRAKADTNKEDDTSSELSKDNLQSSLSQNSLDTQHANDYENQTFRQQEPGTPSENTSTTDTKTKTNDDSTIHRTEPVKKIIRSSITTEEVKEKSFKSYFDTIPSSGFPASSGDYPDYVKIRSQHVKYPSYSSSSSSYQYHHHVENMSKKPEDHVTNSNISSADVTSHKVISSSAKITPESSVPQPNGYESISRPQINIPVKVRRIPQDVRVIHTSHANSLSRLDEFKRNCERATKEWENLVSMRDGTKLTEDVMLHRIAELESNVKEAENLLKLFSAEIREVRATADYWSKKTTNLEKSYHSLHGKVKDYRTNAKQSEQEYLRAIEEREYILQSLREAETREQNLSSLLQRVEDEYNTLSRDIRILERAHAKKDRQLQNLLFEKNELSRKIQNLESHLHKLKNRSESTYRRKYPGHTDETTGRYYSQLGDDSEYVLSDFGSLDRNPKIYTTVTTAGEKRRNNLNINSSNNHLDDSDTCMPQKSEIFKSRGSVDLLDSRKQTFTLSRNMSDSYITPKTNDNTISITRDVKNESVLESNMVDLSPIRHQHHEGHSFQQQSVDKNEDHLSDTLVDENNFVRRGEVEMENNQNNLSNAVHRKWSNASDYQYQPNHQQMHGKLSKIDHFSAEDDSTKHRSQVQVVIGPLSSSEKRHRASRAGHMHKKYTYKKIHEQPVLPSVFSGHGLRASRHRPASVSGYLDEYGLSRPYDLYFAPSSSTRPSTSFGKLYNTRRFKSLDRDCYTSCQNLTTRPYSTMKVIRPSNRVPIISHPHLDRRLREAQHTHYLRYGGRTDSEFERSRIPSSYSAHHMKMQEKVGEIFSFLTTFYTYKLYKMWLFYEKNQSYL